MKRKTKIVCTIGPAVDNDEMIAALIKTGMNVARLNFSHSDYDEHRRRIARIKKIAAKLNRHIAIMADTKGPEIRTGIFEEGGVYYHKNDIVFVLKNEVIGTKEHFSINYPGNFNNIKVGDYLLIDDGKIRMEVTATETDALKCTVRNPGLIKSRKGINIPNNKMNIPFISQKDREDIIFAAKNDVDLIAASFVQSVNDIEDIRTLLKSCRRENIEIIAKIENQQALNDLDVILSATDGIMVARGDLGVEIAAEAVPVYQKKIIQKANELGKPVITATHMLESMITFPRPTRAEVSDIANAVLDGTDAVMLSGETAVGAYPIEAVRMMDLITKATEKIYPYEEYLQKSIKSSEKTINDAIGISVARTALTLPPVGAIVAFTETGGTAKRMCKYRPSVPIIAVTDNIAAAKRLTYYWGVFPVIQKTVTDITEYNQIANTVARNFGLPPGTMIIITSGWGQIHGRTNNLSIITLA